MKSTMIFEGVYPAVTTKFTDAGELDLPAFEKNISVQIDAGVDGVVLGGTLGESSTLSLMEKNQLLSSTLKLAAGRIPVIMNIAEGSTHDAIASAQTAEKLGANGLMLLPPMRYKSDERETTAFFRAVAKSTSLPIMIYNNPVDYKVEVTLNVFESLIDLSNICAVKESTRDISNVTKMINHFGYRYRILCGVDTLAMESLLMGANGWVAGLGCAFPYETVAIYQLIKQGRMQEALLIYRWFLPLLELDIHPKLVQYIKLAEALTGLGTENVRAPRIKLEKEERKQIISVIEKSIANRPKLPTPTETHATY
jgi:1-pyrroline-4-hydroxy-2-carboxylate deaminase